MTLLTPAQLATHFHARTAKCPGDWLLPLLVPGLRYFWQAGNGAFIVGNTQWTTTVPPSLALTGYGAPAVGWATAWPGAYTPYIEFYGTNEYFLRADEAALNPSTAMTWGMWAWLDTSGTQRGLVNKWYSTGMNQCSYQIYTDTSNQVNFVTCATGSPLYGKTVTGGALSLGAWHMIACRYSGGVSQGVYVDGVWTQDTTSVPASLFDGTRALCIGRGINESSVGHWDGRIAQIWMAGFAVPSAVLDYLYQEQSPSYQ